MVTNCHTEGKGKGKLYCRSPRQVCNVLLGLVQYGIHLCNQGLPENQSMDIINHITAICNILQHSHQDSTFIINLRKKKGIDPSKAKLRQIQMSNLEITKISDVIKIFNILLSAEFSQNVHIPICTFVTGKNIMIGNDNNLLSIPYLHLIKRDEKYNFHSPRCKFTILKQLGFMQSDLYMKHIIKCQNNKLIGIQFHIRKIHPLNRCYNNPNLVPHLIFGVRSRSLVRMNYKFSISGNHFLRDDLDSSCCTLGWIITNGIRAQLHIRLRA